MARRLATLILLGAAVAACGTAESPSGPAVPGPTSMASAESSPSLGASDAGTPEPSSPDTRFSVPLVGNFGDPTEAQVVDRSGLVRGLEPGTASGIPVEDYLLPAALNLPAAPDQVQLFWGQVRCRKATDIFVDPLDDGLLVTIAPVGTQDCDTIGSRFELRVMLAREIAAAKIVVRQIQEHTGEVHWVARSPNAPGSTVGIIDVALALAGARLDVPPRLAPAPNGVALSRDGRAVTIAWGQPCGDQVQGEITGTPSEPVLSLGWVDVGACPGTTIRQITLLFIEERGAVNLAVRFAGEL